MVCVATMGHSTATGIHILLFARLREQAGWAERWWPLATTGDERVTPRLLWQALALPGNLEAVRVTINQRFASADTLLQPGDELAFLPPISGG